MESVTGQWDQINRRRKGLTMQDFQKTLLVAGATAILTMLLNMIFVIPRMEERYDFILKSIDSYNAMMGNVHVTLNKQSTDIEVMKNNLEFVKEIANTKVRTIEGRVGVLEYRVGDRKKRED